MSVDSLATDEKTQVLQYKKIELTENGKSVVSEYPIMISVPYEGTLENLKVCIEGTDNKRKNVSYTYRNGNLTFDTNTLGNVIIMTQEGLMGDTNGDGEIDIADALMISRYDAGLTELEASQLSASDVNTDGEVNIADALMISRYDAGLITSFSN